MMVKRSRSINVIHVLWGRRITFVRRDSHASSITLTLLELVAGVFLWAAIVMPTAPLGKNVRLVFTAVVLPVVRLSTQQTSGNRYAEQRQALPDRSRQRPVLVG
jgi:hypothetical protein